MRFDPLTQDCDLDWDFKAATQLDEQQQDQNEKVKEENKRQAKLVPSILFAS